MLATLASLGQLLSSNTLLGGQVPPAITIFQQLEALSQFGLPFNAYDKSDTTIFQSPYWDTLDRYPINREVYGVEQFRHRTTLLLAQLGYDPYSFDTIRQFKPLGLATFPENSPVFMPSSFKDAKMAMEIVRDLVKVDDTTLVIRLEGNKNQPHLSLQSVFNPYFQYFRQRQKEINVSPDLICQQARKTLPLLTHKNTKQMENKILNEGFSPMIGLSILPFNDQGVAEVVLTTLPQGLPYPDKDLTPIKEQESKQANPSGFEI